MRKIVSIKPLNVIALSAILIIPQATAAKNVNLAFSPGESAAIASRFDMPGWLNNTIEIRNVIDGRDHAPIAGKGDVLGVSVQKHHDLYTTHDNLSYWVTRSIVFILHANGCEIVRNNGSIIIEATLKKLFITENSTYQGNACIQFAISNTLGNKLWNQEIIDSSNYWGKTWSEEELLNSLGNVLINTVGKLLENPQLNEILLKQPPPSKIDTHITMVRPEDLGIRGKYRSIPNGLTIFSGALLVGATAVLIGKGYNDRPDYQYLYMLYIPLYIAGGIVGTIAGVKWSIWYNWYYVKPVTLSSLISPRFIVVFNLP